MVNSTAKIQVTVNGQTVTIGEVALPVPTVSALGAQQFALSLDTPLKIDAGTAINFVTSQGGTASIATATVHTTSQRF